MQLKKRPQKNRFRPQVEHLENRLAPAFLGSIIYDGTNLLVSGLDDQTTFTATVGAGPTVTLADTAGSVGGPFNVTGNLTLQVATSNTGAFTGTLALGGNTLLGNATLQFSRASTGTATVTEQTTGAGGILGTTRMTVINGPAAGANSIVNVSTGAAVNLLGGLTINGNSTGGDTINVNPAAGSTIGPMTVNATGPVGTINKVLNLGSAGGATVFGLTANNLDTVNVGTGGTVTINGNANVTTRTNTVGGSTVTFGPTSTVTGTPGFGSVSVKFANNGTSAAHDVATFSGAIFGALSANLGNGFNDLNANTGTTFINGIVSINGNNGTNAVNLSGGSFAGTAIVFTAGNGNNTLNLSNIIAGNAALTVSVGNGTNSVAFGTTATLRSAVLIGGFGSNTFTGTINFTLRTFRFS
jgi:hypothetical protein